MKYSVEKGIKEVILGVSYLFIVFIIGYLTVSETMSLGITLDISLLISSIITTLSGFTMIVLLGGNTRRMRIYALILAVIDLLYLLFALNIDSVKIVLGSVVNNFDLETITFYIAYIYLSSVIVPLSVGTCYVMGKRRGSKCERL